MGRMLEALKHTAVEEEREQADVRPFPAPEEPASDLPDESEASCEEDIPFIEVGGPRAPVEVSQSLSMSVAGPQSGLIVPPHQAVGLTRPEPITVALQPAFSPPSLRPAPELIVFHNPEHAVSKQHYAVLEQIFPASTSVCTLLFTAVTPGAGTTTALLNLALARASRAEHEVVVVDANLRRPAVARRLGLAEVPGLQEVVSGKVALEHALQPTPQQHLQALAAGLPVASQCTSTPQALRWVLAWLRERFDVVFLDGPLVQESESLGLLASAADVVYLVVEHAEVAQAQIRSAGRAIARAGGRVGGTLVTRA
jgi:Mrp family chromosome partitioning ATPase